MSKTIEISRELAQKVDDLLYILTGHDSHPKMIRKYSEEFWIPIHRMRAELCTSLADPAVERQPVAYRYRKSWHKEFWAVSLVEPIEAFGLDKETHVVEPLFTSPPAQVAVVLPERKDVPCGDLQPFERAEAKGWNACLDKVKEMNK